ncbi:MAG: prephenate dehydratase [Acidimicrobiales bacterium]|nr:prephenate dehydratase [Acidimicrobiales bacterium]MDP6298640.1 prephenate dehydratase [Acidimicrobiales bacterium]HJM27730.1 prephenate dehydratase [Acidimicrobiales bacterium]HJM98301.1 prephenate dehydratase [Acidimicrobiales bacterium]
MDELKSLKVGYLGPEGTFTESALLTQSDLAESEHVLFRSHSDVLHNTATGKVDFGFCAIENAIEGTVNVVQDTLAFDSELMIQREVVIPITMNLLVKKGTSLDDVEKVISYPHALAQVRSFLRNRLPEAELEAANSTAHAAQMLAAVSSDNVAAVGTSLAAEKYGLEIVAEGIEDHSGNQTRFVLIARDGIPAPTGHDKTSIVVFQQSDKPGSLLAILQEFAARSINLTKLESRPTREALGNYCFFLDLEGHIADSMMADCLKTLQAKDVRVKFLGSYPAAGEQAEEVRQESNDALDKAQSWLDSIRSKLR